MQHKTSLPVWCGSENYISAEVHKLPQKSRSHIKILGAKKWRSTFHTEDPQILGATVQTLQLHAQLDFVTLVPFTMNGKYNSLWDHTLVNRKGLNLSLRKLWRHWREKTYSSTHFYLSTKRKWSDSSPSRCNCCESTPQYQIWRTVGRCAPEPVTTFYRKENYPVCVENQAHYGLPSEY